MAATQKTPGQKFAHLHERGYTPMAIARMYSVTEESVREVLTGEGITWPPGMKPGRRKHNYPSDRKRTEAVRDPDTIYSARGLDERLIAFVEPPRSLVWCAQCDRRVASAEGARCQSRFCKAKAHQALGLAIAGHEMDKARVGG